MSRSRIAGHLHTIFHKGCTNLHYHQHSMRVPFFPHTGQHLLLLHFWIIAILTGVRRYFIVASICISLIISDVEHLFTHLLAICMLSLEKISVHLLCPFYKLGGLFFCCCVHSWFILDISSLLDISFANIFSQMVGCLVVLSKVSFAVQKLFSLM